MKMCIYLFIFFVNNFQLSVQDWGPLSIIAKTYPETMDENDDKSYVWLE